MSEKMYQDWLINFICKYEELESEMECLELSDEDFP